MVMDLQSMSAEDIGKMISNCHSSLAELAQDDRYPGVIDALAEQVEMDKKRFARLPTFISVPTNQSGLVNTTIRTSQFLQFWALYKQRPDLVGTKLAENILHPKSLPLVNDSGSAEDGMGAIPKEYINGHR